MNRIALNGGKSLRKQHVMPHRCRLLTVRTATFVAKRIESVKANRSLVVNTLLGY